MAAIGIIGRDGRMGQAIAAAIEGGEHTLAGAVDKGEDVAGLADRSEVLIDFSAPQALEGNLHAAVGAGVPLLIGTTGLEERITPRSTMLRARSRCCRRAIPRWA